MLMHQTTKQLVLLCAGIILALSSCQLTEGSNSYRAKNKCCGIIKCDMHRRSAKVKHKRVVNGHKKLRKKEANIKRGW